MPALPPRPLSVHRPGRATRPAPGQRHAASMAGRLAHSRGVSLVEVLVAVLLFSFGLLGLVGLQARATQVSMSAEDSNRAALLANELAAAMWTSQTVTLPAATVEAWNARVADAAGVGLPSGEGTVSVDDNVATVTVTWTPPGARSGTQHRYQTQVMLP